MLSNTNLWIEIKLSNVLRACFACNGGCFKCQLSMSPLQCRKGQTKDDFVMILFCEITFKYQSTHMFNVFVICKIKATVITMAFRNNSCRCQHRYLTSISCRCINPSFCITFPVILKSFMPCSPMASTYHRGFQGFLWFNWLSRHWNTNGWKLKNMRYQTDKLEAKYQ